MLRKILLASAAVAAFSLAASSAGTAEAGGPYRGGFGSFGPFPPSFYPAPSRHSYRSHRGFAPPRADCYRGSSIYRGSSFNRGYPSYYGRRGYGYGGFGGPGMNFRSPGFSLRLGF